MTTAGRPGSSAPRRPSGVRRGWRDADLAQKGGPRPASVRGVVLGVTRRLRALRLVEGALLTVGIAAAVAAAAYASGLERARVDAVGVAALAGVLGGLAWYLEHRLTEANVVRRLDGRLRHGGALVTAWELERDGAGAPLARLCVERVLDRLRTAEALRALRPSPLPPVVVPMAGLALLALALEARRAVEVPRFLPLEGLEGDLDALSAGAFEARDAGVLGDEALRRALAVRGAIDELRIELAGDEPPPDGARRVADLDQALAELAPDLVGDPHLSEEVDRLRARLDALRDGLAPDAPSGPPPDAAGALARTAAPDAGGLPAEPDAIAAAGGAPAGAAGAAGGGAAATSGAGEGGAGAGESIRAALASEGVDGTMRGSAAPQDPPDAAAGTPAGAFAPGVRIWWDPADDGLVADWVELLRQHRAR